MGYLYVQIVLKWVPQNIMEPNANYLKSVTLEPVDQFSSFWGLFHSKMVVLIDKTIVIFFRLCGMHIAHSSFFKCLLKNRFMNKLLYYRLFELVLVEIEAF